MKHHYLGIDNGLQGYLALLDEEGNFIEHWPTPTRQGQTKAGGIGYDPDGMVELLTTINKEYEGLIVIFEKTHAFPIRGGKDSGKSMGSAKGNFNAGFGYGLWLMAIVALKLRFRQVSSQMWQNRCGVREAQGATSKDRSVNAALRRWPGVDLRKNARCRKLLDGKSDSLWLAEFGRRYET